MQHQKTSFYEFRNYDPQKHTTVWHKTKTGLDYTVVLDTHDYRLLCSADRDGRIRFNKNAPAGYIIDKYDGRKISVRSFLAPDGVPFVKLIQNPIYEEYQFITDMRSSNIIYGNFKILGDSIVKSGKTKYNEFKVSSKMSDIQKTIVNVLGSNRKLEAHGTVIAAGEAVYMYGDAAKLSDLVPRGSRAFIKSGKTYVMNVDDIDTKATA